MCRNCNWTEYDTHDAESFKALARAARRLDFSAMGCSVRPDVQWLMSIADWGPVDENGDKAAHEDAEGAQHRYALMCKSFQGGMDDPRFVQSFVGDGPPAADVVLDFVRVCIANPAPAMLPATLILTAAFLPYAATLTPFLSALPAPFTYKFQSRAHARAHAAFLFEKAEEFKLQGNVMYGRCERAAAVEAYAEAADICEHVLLLGHAERDMRGAEKLRAVCLANRAAAHLLDGPGQDVQQALSDGVEAERADSEYVKGYLRQMRAHVLLKNLGEARRVLERAAGKVQGADVQVVAQALDALPQ